jgi:hypothetical protein
MSHPDQVDDPPPGADPVSTELWTPPEKLSSNVGRMAWSLFLKWWENYIPNATPDNVDGVVAICETTYRHCIAVAKALEEINQDPSKTDG